MGSKKPKVIFKINLYRDAWNYYCAANSNPKWGYDFSKIIKPEIVKKVRRKKWEKTRNYLYKMLRKGYSIDKKKMNSNLKSIKSSWKKVEEKYFQKLEKITKKKIYTNKFHCYITTIGRCPYNQKENWFMVNIFSNDASTTIAHELMHLQFYHYFEKEIRKTLNEKQFQDLKEALTILLNMEFKGILKEKDKGYPGHKKLRNFIEKEWKKRKDFDVLIEKYINYRDILRHPKGCGFLLRSRHSKTQTVP